MEIFLLIQYKFFFQWVTKMDSFIYYTLALKGPTTNSKIHRFQKKKIVTLVTPIVKAVEKSKDLQTKGM